MVTDKATVEALAAIGFWDFDATHLEAERPWTDTAATPHANRHYDGKLDFYATFPGGSWLAEVVEYSEELSADFWHFAGETEDEPGTKFPSTDHAFEAWVESRGTSTEYGPTHGACSCNYEHHLSEDYGIIVYPDDECGYVALVSCCTSGGTVNGSDVFVVPDLDCLYLDTELDFYWVRDNPNAGKLRLDGTTEPDYWEVRGSWRGGYDYDNETPFDFPEFGSAQVRECGWHDEMDRDDPEYADPDDPQYLWVDDDHRLWWLGAKFEFDVRRSY